MQIATSFAGTIVRITDKTSRSRFRVRAVTWLSQVTSPGNGLPRPSPAIREFGMKVLGFERPRRHNRSQRLTDAAAATALTGC